MGWRCPACKSTWDDTYAECQECGNERVKVTINAVFHVNIDQANVPYNVQQSPAKSGRYVIDCPDCGREIPVDGKDAELEKCPYCGSGAIEGKSPYFKTDEGLEPKGEEVEPHPRLFIQEIHGEPEISNSLIYHQRGSYPEPISSKIEIFPPETEFGRNDLPKQGDYYNAISEKHCKFRLDENGDWLVQDTRSTNHTRVGRRMLIGGQEVRLKHGEQIQIANRLFIVSIE